MPKESRAKYQIWLCDKDRFVMPAAQICCVKILDLRIFHTSLHSFSGRPNRLSLNSFVFYHSTPSAFCPCKIKILPISSFVIKNGYSDLVVMSSELYDKFAGANRIDQAIYESEKEMEEGGESIDLDTAFERLNIKDEIYKKPENHRIFL